MDFKNFVNADMFEAFDETEMLILLQPLPAPPKEDPRSNASESQAPMLWGSTRITVGTFAKAGGEMANVAFVTADHWMHSDDKTLTGQKARTMSGSN